MNLDREHTQQRQPARVREFSEIVKDDRPSPPQMTIIGETLYTSKQPPLLVCVCFLRFLPIYSGHQVRRMYQPAGVTQEEGHTGFLIHLPSAVRALIFLARRIQPFPSLVDREVKFFSITIFIVLHLLGFFFFFFFSEQKSRLPGFELTSQRGRRVRGYFF